MLTARPGLTCLRVRGRKRDAFLEVTKGQEARPFQPTYIKSRRVEETDYKDEQRDRNRTHLISLISKTLRTSNPPFKLSNQNQSSNLYIDEIHCYLDRYRYCLCSWRFSFSYPCRKGECPFRTTTNRLTLFSFCV